MRKVTNSLKEQINSVNLIIKWLLTKIYKILIKDI